MGIGKLTAIYPVHLQVAPRKSEDAALFSFSRTWTAFRTLLHLAAGQLALANVTYLVADDELACEDPLPGLPVLRHIHVDTKPLLETTRTALDGADCSFVGTPAIGDRSGRLSRMMVDRLNSIVPQHPTTTPQLSESRPRVDYNTAHNDLDPFPDPSLLDPIDDDQQEKRLKIC